MVVALRMCFPVRICGVSRSDLRATGVKIKLICFVVSREYNSSPSLGPNRVEIHIREYVCIYL
jgi:hypothetical protein